MFKSRFAPAATLLLMAVAIAGAFGVAATTHADQVYHSERLVLSPTNLNDGGTGQVINIHPNGPVVGALERYQLRGGEAYTAYEVWIQLCDVGNFSFLLTATLGTDKHGNGHAQGYFSAEALVPFSGLVVEIRWSLRLGGTDVYVTKCTTVTID